MLRSPASARRHRVQGVTVVPVVRAPPPAGPPRPPAADPRRPAAAEAEGMGNPARRAAIGLTLLAACGCAEPPGEFREVLRVDETLTESHLALLERIAGTMEDGRLPAMAPHFLPAPRWTADRPAGVAALAKEELARLREVRRLGWLTDSLGHETRLKHVVRREGLSLDQYAALVLSVGMASHRSRVDAARDLDRYVRVGRAEQRRLKDQTQSFASLDEKRRAEAVERATWITRVDRAERLLAVPPENAAFAEAHRLRLERILPKAFLKEPLAAISVPLLDRGVPFREQSETGFDADLFWSRSDERAVIGGRSVAAEAEPDWY